MRHYRCGIISLGLLASACSTVTTGSNAAAALKGSRWRLVEIGGQPVQAADSAHRPGIRFDSTGTLTGHGGCNGFGGRYTAGDSTLRITDIVSTMMACVSNPLNIQEQRYLAALRSTEHFRIANDTLTLFGGTAPISPLARLARDFGVSQTSP